MPLMLSELYDALLEAGASEGKARKAAEAVAAYDNRFAALESRLVLIQWMLGTVLIVVLGVLWKVIKL